MIKTRCYCCTGELLLSTTSDATHLMVWTLGVVVSKCSRNNQAIEEQKGSKKHFTWRCMTHGTPDGSWNFLSRPWRQFTSLKASPRALAWLVVYSTSHEAAHERQQDSLDGQESKARSKKELHDSWTTSRVVKLSVNEKKFWKVSSLSRGPWKAFLGHQKDYDSWSLSWDLPQLEIQHVLGLLSYTF